MKRLKISILNEQKLVDIDSELKKIIRSCCKAALSEEQFDEPCEISISFVTNDRIKEINRLYRNIDSYTDVLSFPLADNKEFDINPDSGCYMLGDIIISTERAQEQANEIGHSLQREIAFLIVHSMLHILGHDHTSEDSPETILMRKKEKIILFKAGIISREI